MENEKSIYIDRLEDRILGSCEVKGFVFDKQFENKIGYIFRVTDQSFNYWFEIFEKKITPKLVSIDEKTNQRTYSETDFKERYQKGEDFGVWAWTYSLYEQAMDKLISIGNMIKIKEMANTDELLKDM